MATPHPQGIQIGSILPLIYQTEVLNDIRLTPHKFITDYYDAYFKHFGFDRIEMEVVMPIIERVDILSGTHTSDYLPPPEDAFKM